MTLSDYDSDEDADYHPSESEESDELEYDSDFSVSSEEEMEEVADVSAENWMYVRSYYDWNGFILEIKWVVNETLVMWVVLAG